MVLLLLALVTLLAFANGANDNCKGVATLVGYGAATPRRALIWAAITTAAGAAISFWFAGGLIASFSGGALFAARTSLETPFFIAVLAGAFGWVLVATFTGMPVSTTHAITGALAGAGIAAFGGHELRWSALAANFALPLALGPLLALATVYLLGWPVMFILPRLAGRCICVTPQMRVAAAGPDGLASAAPAMELVVDDESNCAEQSPAIAVTTSSAARAIHWASSGMVGFARGWNDAPKIAALALVALPGNMSLAFATVTFAMALGGLLAGRKVLATLARKVTPLPLGESLTASTTSALLVGLASWNGLPVSTTHITAGGIVGAGLKRDPRAVRWRTVGEITLSWLITLPVAALLAFLAMRVLS